MASHLIARVAPRKRGASFACATVGLLFPAFVPLLRSAETAARSFNLPADVAEVSLKRFAAQSGTEIVFATSTVGKVRTNAVTGTYSPREALDRLVANTPLTVVEQPKTGTIMIHSGTAPAKQETPVKSKPSDTTEKPPNTMNSKTPLAWLGGIFSLLTAADPLSAQSAATSPVNDSVVELSPFVVNSTKDIGYQAMNTLAGTRLDTPLRDIGAAVSIYTRDFLDDIGATNMNELLIYAPNMEISGPAGNFSSGNQLNDFNSTTVPQTENNSSAVRSNSQATGRSRGLSSPTFTRNFYNALIAIDTYNTDRITVLRGPNAALFGTSSPGGVTDTSLIRAEVRRDSNKVSFRLDDNGGHRATVDFNRVLIPDKLGVRLAGLQARAEYDQRPAYETRERLFGTVTYEPFKSTILRANFETGRTNANRPNPLVPSNAIANDWYSAGRPGFDWTFYDDPARNPLAASQQLSNALYPVYQRNAPFNVFAIFYNNSDDQVLSYTMRPTVPNTTAAARAANAYIATLLHPLINKDSANDAINFTTTNSVFEMTAASYWVGGNVLPGQLAGQLPPGAKPQGFLNFDAFDWENRMIDETSRYQESYHGGNVTLQQTAWDNRLGLELAYDQQRLDNRFQVTYFNGFASGSSTIRIDTTATLPNGLPNSNYGRPFAGGSAYQWNNNIYENETRRATLYLKYDFKDLNADWGKWIGRHTLSGVREIYQTKSVGYQLRPAVDGPYARTVNPLLTARTPSYVVYLGPSLIGNNNPLRLNPVKVAPPASGPAGDLQYFTRNADATDVGSFTTGPFSIVQYSGGGPFSREIIKAKAATLQSYWLDGLVATVLGWRRDADYFINKNTAFTSNPANLSDPGKVAWGLDDMDWPNLPPPTIAAESRSYSVVLNWPKKLINLPKGTDFSVFYNNSENFTPVGGRINSWGVPLDPPRGKTEEYGFNLFTFDNKLTLRVNRFETANKYATNNSAAFAQISNFPLSLILAWKREANINSHLQAMRDADLAKVTATLPGGENFYKLYNVTVTGTPPNIVTTRNSSLSGSGDTQDYTAKGEEIDIIYNPTPQWRILANIAHQEAVKTNLLPSSRYLLSLYKPALDQLRDRAFALYPTGWQIGDPLPATVETVGAAFDRLIGVQLASELATENTPSAEARNWRWNLVTNYTFGKDPLFGERLKGWSVGGGIRWQDKMILGYPSSRLANTTPVFDIDHPWYAPAQTNIDVFVGYGRKIWNSRVDWKVQLNATNLFRQSALIPIAAQPWGEPSAMRIAPEQRWYLNNTFSF